MQGEVFPVDYDTEIVGDVAVFLRRLADCLLNRRQDDFTAYAALAFDPARSYSPQREGEAVGRWDALRDNAFASGGGVFCFTSLSAVPALRERGASFSVLPYPKVDPAAEYQSPLDLFGTDLLCLPFYQQDRERTGIITEALAFLSRELVRPALADRCLPETGERREEETELFDLLLSRRAYDLGALYGLGDYPLTLPAADSPVILPRMA